jgi:uncharacterized protein YecE (DUF72 family)
MCKGEPSEPDSKWDDHLIGINDATILIGCCGWPEAKENYFSRFSTVELQTTFYEPPTLALASKWLSLAPPSSRFCIKAWRLITHQTSSPTYRRLKSKLSREEHDLLGSFRPTEQVWLAWERTQATAKALEARVILFQCPRSFTPDHQNLSNFRSFFSRIERGAHLLAWEPRGEAWTNDLVRGLCSEFRLVHCVDPFERESVHGPIGYWRLHGRGGYRHKYSDHELIDLRQMASRHSGKLFVFFNNVYMKPDSTRFQSLLQAQ